MDKYPFAEIEIKTNETEVKGQKIKGPDPIREKFYDMRGLAPNNPDSWQNAKLFYRQGKFMESFVDDYAQNVPLTMYSPCYQRLGYDQLRAYFSWRTKARQGNFTETSLSYVFLHIYELLCGIGSKGPVDGLNKIIILWRTYSETNRVLDNYLPGWLKDYHIYYKLPHSFAEFIEICNLQKYYADWIMFNLNEETTFQNWLDAGTYDMNKSKFYKAGNQKLMHTAFYKGIVEMQKHLNSLGKHLEDLFYYRSSTVSWKPFESAVFYPWYRQADKEVYLSPYHVYKCVNNNWSTRKAIHYKHKTDLIRYFIKDMEMQLRTITGFRGSFTVGTDKISTADAVVKGMGTSMKVLTNIFNNVAKETHYEFTRVVVTVDTHNLERIREEAEVTQEKLIVEEAELALFAPWDANSNILSNDEVLAADDASSPWEMLKNSLVQVETDALKVALTSPHSIKNFADENGIMLEILADGINEKAMDTIGDNILELTDIMIVYEDYIAEVENLLHESSEPT